MPGGVLVHSAEGELIGARRHHRRQLRQRRGGGGQRDRGRRPGRRHRLIPTSGADRGPAADTQDRASIAETPPVAIASSSSQPVRPTLKRPTADDPGPTAPTRPAAPVSARLQTQNCPSLQTPGTPRGSRGRRHPPRYNETTPAGARALARTGTPLISPAATGWCPNGVVRRSSGPVRCPG